MKFEYGKLVRIVSDAPPKWNPDRKGWVVGYRTIDNPVAAREFNQEMGTGVYLIEFEENPSGTEIPEAFIVEEENK
jgi:hypothetical protein